VIVRRSALVDHPAEIMFDLIEAAEHYPAFLPWCAAVRIVGRDDSVVCADVEVRWRGAAFALSTRNPKRRPEHMAIHLVHGPFEHFEGEWRLTALGEGACKVDFALDYAFASGLMTRVAGPLFERIANTLVDAFVHRADDLAGTAG
jgi:ribosome-associated toxin RatA of RatAB toxin-antitoxin module